MNFKTPYHFLTPQSCNNQHGNILQLTSYEISEPTALKLLVPGTWVAVVAIL